MLERWREIAEMIPLLSALLLVGGVYLYGIEIPRHDYDEPTALSVRYGIAAYGDSSYALYDSEDFGNGTRLTVPARLPYRLRDAFHGIAGFSAKSSRVFSAIMIWGTLLLAAAALLRCGMSAPWAAMVVLVAGLHPSVVQTARSVRNEQETLFLGAGALFLAVILVGRYMSRHLPALRWCLVGFFSVFAAASHPWGIIFVLVALLSAVLDGKYWQATDQLNQFERLAWFGSGAILPFIYFILPCIQNWDGFQTAVKDFHWYYSHLDERYVESLSSRSRWNLSVLHFTDLFDVLRGWLPRRIFAQFMSLDASAYTNVFRGSLFYLFHYVFWFNIVLCLAALPFTLMRSLELVKAMRRITVWMAIGFCGWHFIYGPRIGNYQVYASFSVTVAAAYLLWEIWSYFRTRGLRVSMWLTGCIVFLQVALGICFAAQYVGWTHGVSNSGSAVSLDTKISELEAVGLVLGVPDNAKPFFVDVMTWPVGGKNRHSLFHAVMAGRMPAPSGIGGVAITCLFMEIMTTRWSNFGERQYSLSERKQYLASLISALRLKGLVVEKKEGIVSSADYYIFTNRVSPNEGIHVGVLQGGGRSRRFISAPIAPAAYTKPVVSLDGKRWNSVGSGKYLLLIERFEGLQKAELFVKTPSVVSDNIPSYSLAMDSLSDTLLNAYIIDIAEDGSAVELRFEARGQIARGIMLLKLDPA